MLDEKTPLNKIYWIISRYVKYNSHKLISSKKNQNSCICMRPKNWNKPNGI